MILNDPFDKSLYLGYSSYTYSKWVQDRVQRFISAEDIKLASNNADCKIIFFGDSHSDFISRDLEIWINDKLAKVDCFWLGPITAYRIIRDGFGDLLKFPLTRQSLVLCPCFGEIDLRMHWRKFTTALEACEYSKSFVSQYCRRILDLKAQVVASCSVEPLIVLVCPPPPRKKSFFSPDGECFPQASDEERLVFHNCFRDSLKSFALRHSFGCLDLTEIASDSSGYLSDKHSDTSVHVVGLSEKISMLLKMQILEI